MSELVPFGQKLKYFTDHNRLKEGPRKNDFLVFSNSEMNITTARLEKGRRENRVICLVSMFPSWVMVLELSKKVRFLQFCADLSKKSRSIKAIYINVSGRSRYPLSANGFVYYVMTYCFGDVSIWNWRILLNFCWFNIFFDILITNILWAVARTPVNHTIFW